MKTDKPWGYEIVLEQNENYVMKKIHINSGERLSLQYHEDKEETIYVESGVCHVWHSEDELDITILEEGDVFHVKPKQVHRFGSPKCRCKDGVYKRSRPTVLLECSTNHLDDVVRIKDDYKRVEKDEQ